jgi:hypothetical protein
LDLRFSQNLDDGAVSTSEMTVNVYETTWHNIPEDSHLHTHRCDNLKSHNGEDIDPQVHKALLPRRPTSAVQSIVLNLY